jgi:hypothetical protein
MFDRKLATGLIIPQKLLTIVSKVVIAKHKASVLTESFSKILVIILPSLQHENK